jgi:hypothetical protein
MRLSCQTPAWQAWTGHENRCPVPQDRLKLVLRGQAIQSRGDFVAFDRPQTTMACRTRDDQDVTSRRENADWMLDSWGRRHIINRIIAEDG